MERKEKRKCCKKIRELFKANGTSEALACSCGRWPAIGSRHPIDRASQWCRQSQCDAVPCMFLSVVLGRLRFGSRKNSLSASLQVNPKKYGNTVANMDTGDAMGGDSSVPHIAHWPLIRSISHTDIARPSARPPARPPARPLRSIRTDAFFQLRGISLPERILGATRQWPPFRIFPSLPCTPVRIRQRMKPLSFPRH